MNNAETSDVQEETLKSDSRKTEKERNYATSNEDACGTTFKNSGNDIEIVRDKSIEEQVSQKNKNKKHSDKSKNQIRLMLFLVICVSIAVILIITGNNTVNNTVVEQSDNKTTFVVQNDKDKNEVTEKGAIKENTGDTLYDSTKESSIEKSKTDNGADTDKSTPDEDYIINADIKTLEKFAGLIGTSLEDLKVMYPHIKEDGFYDKVSWYKLDVPGVSFGISYHFPYDDTPTCVSISVDLRCAFPGLTLYSNQIITWQQFEKITDCKILSQHNEKYGEFCNYIKVGDYSMCVSAIDESYNIDINNSWCTIIVYQDQTDYEVHPETDEKNLFAASSTMSNTESLTYYPSNAFDGDITTAWGEYVSGNGVGESLSITFGEPVNIQAFGFDNGYAKSESLYYENNRPELLKFLIETESGTQEAYFSFEDKYDGDFYYQYQDSFKQVKSITVFIEKVYEGTKYANTYITDIFFYDENVQVIDLQ